MSRTTDSGSEPINHPTQGAAAQRRSDPGDVLKPIEPLSDEHTASYNHSPRWKELTHAGHFGKPDEITGGPTAIASGASGRAATLEDGGAGPRNGADFPGAVRARDRETHRSIAQAHRRITALQSRWSDRHIAQELIDALVNRRKNVSDHELREHIDFLRSRIPIVSRDVIASEDRKYLSGAEAKVYLDDAADPYAVYKLIDTEEGKLAGGFVASKIAPDPDGGVRIIGEVIPTVLDLFSRIDLNNRHGGLVYTEIAGVTPDGAVVLKQPYIQSGAYTDWLETELKLPSRNLRAVSRDDSIAVGEVDGKLILFEDLAPRNVLHTPDGVIYIIDSPSRRLTPQEAEMIASHRV